MVENGSCLEDDTVDDMGKILKDVGDNKGWWMREMKTQFKNWLDVVSQGEMITVLGGVIDGVKGKK